MLAVIFTAQVPRFDAEHAAEGARLRALAVEQFGCRSFMSCTENGVEIAVSYWDSEEQIIAWKQHPDHLAAQRRGCHEWYGNYQVQVVRIVRQYGRELQPLKGAVASAVASAVEDSLEPAERTD